MSDFWENGEISCRFDSAVWQLVASCLVLAGMQVQESISRISQTDDHLIENIVAARIIDEWGGVYLARVPFGYGVWGFSTCL